MGWRVVGADTIPNDISAPRYSAYSPTNLNAVTRRTAQIGKVTWLDGQSHELASVSRLAATVSGTGGAGKMEIQGVSTSAFAPDGAVLSAKAGTNNVFAAWATVPTTGEYHTVTLAVADRPTLTHRQKIAVVDYLTNVGSSLSVQITGNSQGGFNGDEGVAFSTDSGATYSPTSALLPNILLTATDGAYGYLGPMRPVSAITQTSFASGTKLASVLRAPFACELTGFKWGFASVSAAAAWDLSLTDQDGAQVGANAASFLAANQGFSSSLANRLILPDGPIILTPGQIVMAVCTPTTANACVCGAATAPTSTGDVVRDAMSYGAYIGTRTYSGGSWGSIDWNSRHAMSFYVRKINIPPRRNSFGGHGCQRG